jgi:hypothetical protein
MPGLSRRASHTLLALAGLVMFGAGFHSNSWGAARRDWFENFQRGTECHVLGRLVQSRQAGILSAGGLLGVGVSRFERAEQPLRYGVHFRRANLASGIHIREEGEDWPAGEQIDHQYDAYLDGLRFEIYSPYLSQIGGQGMLFGVLDALLPLAPRTKLELFRLLCALLSAAALTLVVLWFARELSPGIALLVLTTALLSQWLVGFGRNLWWGLWAFYLPFVLLAHASAAARRHPTALFGLAFLAVLLKCFVNGYEYITTTLVMMTVPWVYQARREGAPARAWRRGALALGLGAAAAIAVSLAVLTAQLAWLKGTPRFGVKHVLFSLAARTQAAPEDLPPQYGPGLTASHLGVLTTYLQGAYFDLGGRWPVLDAQLPPELLALRYDQLLAAVAAAALLLLVLGRAAAPEQRRSDGALLLAAAVSLLAPLSWFVVFKAHSYEHTHMNFVLWQMPFSFFGFALCGVAAARLWHRLARR